MTFSTFSDVWKPRVPKIDFDSASCSCGIGKLLDLKKLSRRDLLNMDLYTLGDPLCFTTPTRHSKSLDHLQLCSNNFPYSLNNIRNYRETSKTAPNENSHYRSREPALKNVASEHNMRKNCDNNKYSFEEPDENICSCSFNNYNSLRPVNKTKNHMGGKANVNVIVNSSQCVVEKKYKQFSIKNLSNVSKQYHTIVKSLNQTPSGSTQNIFKSNSMQFFSPRKKIRSNPSKFSSLLSRKIEKSRKFNYQSLQNGSPSEPTGDKKNHNQNRKSKSRNNHVNGKHFEIGSTSSSTESLMMDKQKTGSKCKALLSSSSIRRIRSTSCIVEEQTPLVLSGTESLPDIPPKIEERLYPEMRYYSSSSSSTSEQSGWITSRSSSIGNVFIFLKIKNMKLSLGLSNILFLTNSLTVEFDLTYRP